MDQTRYLQCTLPGLDHQPVVDPILRLFQSPWELWCHTPSSLPCHRLTCLARLKAMHAAKLQFCTLCPHPLLSSISLQSSPSSSSWSRQYPAPPDLPRPQCPSLHLFCIAVLLQVCSFQEQSASLKPSWGTFSNPQGSTLSGPYAGACTKTALSVITLAKKAPDCHCRSQGLRSVWSLPLSPLFTTTIQQHPTPDSWFTHETEILRRPKESKGIVVWIKICLHAKVKWVMNFFSTCVGGVEMEEWNSHWGSQSHHYPV